MGPEPKSDGIEVEQVSTGAQSILLHFSQGSLRQSAISQEVDGDAPI